MKWKRILIIIDRSITEQGPKENGSFYGLGIHLMDRMIALFGRQIKSLMIFVIMK